MRAFFLSLILGFTGALAGGAYLLWEHHPERRLIDRRLDEQYQSFAESRRLKESSNYLALYRLRLQHRRHYGASVSLRRNMSAEHVANMREKADARAARTTRLAKPAKTGMAAAFASLPPASPANLAMGKTPIVKASASLAAGQRPVKAIKRSGKVRLRTASNRPRKLRKLRRSRTPRIARHDRSRRPSQQ